MALASTLTDVANLALSSIGEQTITNIDTDNRIENIVRLHLSESIRQVQQEILWGELRVSFEPIALPDNYLDSASMYQFNMPNNFLDMVSINSGAEWFLESGKLVTTDPTPVVTYKRYSEEPTEWSGYLVEMVYRRLAMNIAPHLTQNAGLVQNAVQQYEMCRVSNLTKSSNRRRSWKEKERVYPNLKSRRFSSKRTY